MLVTLKHFTNEVFLLSRRVIRKRYSAENKFCLKHLKVYQNSVLRVKGSSYNYSFSYFKILILFFNRGPQEIY